MRGSHGKRCTCTLTSTKGDPCCGVALTVTTGVSASKPSSRKVREELSPCGCPTIQGSTLTPGSHSSLVRRSSFWRFGSRSKAARVIAGAAASSWGSASTPSAFDGGAAAGAAAAVVLGSGGVLARSRARTLELRRKRKAFSDATKAAARSRKSSGSTSARTGGASCCQVELSRGVPSGSICRKVSRAPPVRL